MNQNDTYESLVVEKCDEMVSAFSNRLFESPLGQGILQNIEEQFQRNDKDPYIKYNHARVHLHSLGPGRPNHNVMSTLSFKHSDNGYKPVGIHQLYQSRHSTRDEMPDTPRKETETYFGDCDRFHFYSKEEEGFPHPCFKDSFVWFKSELWYNLRGQLSIIPYYLSGYQKPFHYQPTVSIIQSFDDKNVKIPQELSIIISPRESGISLESIFCMDGRWRDTEHHPRMWKLPYEKGALQSLREYGITFPESARETEENYVLQFSLTGKEGQLTKDIAIPKRIDFIGQLNKALGVAMGSGSIVSTESMVDAFFDEPEWYFSICDKEPLIWRP